MNRSEVLKEVASQVVMEYPEIPWDQAQRLADIILRQLEYHNVIKDLESEDE